MDFKNILQTLSHLSEGAQKKAKPDFLDMDKDGNKKEPMKKASKDAKKALVGKAISKKKGTLKDWFEHIDAKYLAENTAPGIDGSATSNYALKMVKALNDRFGGEYFEHAFNKDGSVTIVKQGMWADEAARRLGRDPNRDPDLKLPGALTGKNFNDAINPWYREFRNKGWRFDQPVNGKFTIAVTKQQGVTEAVPSGTIDSPATANYALKMVNALNDRFGGKYFEYQTNKDGSMTIFKPGMWADEAGRALGRDPDRDPDYKRPDVLTGKNFNDAIDTWYYEFRNKGWRFDQPMNGKFTIAVMKKPGVTEAEQVTIQPMKQNAQVIKQGNQTLGTVTNPALASTIKSAIGKGEMSLAGAQLGETEDEYSAKKARAGKDIGKPGKNFAKIAKSAGKKYGSKESGERVAGAVLAKLRNLKEAERPSDDSDMGAGLGAGRSRTTFEGAKPDFLDMDKDGNKKESMKKAVADKKKQKVKESMNHRISAARLEGKSHGLRGHAHSGKRYEDLEEMKAYHEGYKEGLDECYGQGVYEGVLGTLGGAALGGMLGGPVGAAVGAVGGQEMTKGGSAVFEKSLPATVSGMASQEMQEGEEFGAYDYEQLAQSVYDEHPDLSTSGDAKELMNVGYELAVEMFGPKVARQSFGYNKDFPSDFASAYRYLQRNDKDAKTEGIGGVAGKVLPGVGATLAAQDAYKRQQAGDTTGAVISGLSGAAGLVPGVGTAASLAGTGIQAARDKARTGSWFPDQKQIAAASQKDPFTESLEIQLQKLLSESNEKVDEGLSVTISKGQQGAPDSVSVSAQDDEADQLLGLIKNAGLGLFGDNEQGTSNYGAPSGSSEVNSPGGIEVVDDHDGMMGIMKKLSGIQQSGDEDYADEEGEEDCGCEGECDCGQQECNECGGAGMHESSCSSSKEMIDEVESEDQQEFEVAEDNAPDSGEAESTADEDAEAEEDKALAGADSGNEEELDEWAPLVGMLGRAALPVAAGLALNNAATSAGTAAGTAAGAGVGNAAKIAGTGIGLGATLAGGGYAASKMGSKNKEEIAEIAPLVGMLGRAAAGAAGSVIGNKLAGATNEDEGEELNEVLPLVPLAIGAAGSFIGNKLAGATNEDEGEELNEVLPLVPLAIGAAGSFIGNKLAGAIGEEDELDEVEQIDEKVKIFQRDQNPNPQRDYAGTPVRYPKGHSAHGDAHRAIVAKAAKASRREGSLKGSDKSTWRRQNDNHQLHAGHADKEYNPKMEEYELNEWANNAGGKGTDEAFERDIEFMTNIISGGLNKRKSTGQTTVPVIASQTERQYSQESTSINESINDWQKLAGIKKL